MSFLSGYLSFLEDILRALFSAVPKGEIGMILEGIRGKVTFTGWPEFDMVKSASVDLRKRSRDEDIFFA